MLLDFDEGSSYSIGDGKAEVCFTYSKPQYAAQSNRIKYLHVQNKTPVTLFFAFCTKSPCQCTVCQEWLVFETIPIVDWPGWTVGRLQVDPFSSKVERFCSQWDCIGSCFVETWPSQVEKADLFDFDEDSDYSIADGLVTLSFTYEPPTQRAQSGGYKSAGSHNGPSAATGVAGAGIGVVGAVNTAFTAYHGVQMVNDMAGGDLIDTLGEAVASSCVIS